MGKIKKVMGWHDCTVTNGEDVFRDIMKDTTDLSVEEGQEEEALIESNEAEGRYKEPDKYILKLSRRVGEENVTPGFTEDVGEVTVQPVNKGARGVKLSGVSRHIALEFKSKDGLVANYTYKTKGAVDDDGNLTDVEITTTPTGAPDGNPDGN